MYSYIVNFALAKDQRVSLAKFEEDIKDAIFRWNEAGLTARNKKKVTKWKVTESVITLYLQSDECLMNPTKAFRSFSKFLVDNSELKKYVYNGRLFKGWSTTIEVNKNESIKEMSDEEMLATLIKWCIGKSFKDVSDKKNKLKIIENIKKLIAENVHESGITQERNRQEEKNYGDVSFNHEMDEEIDLDIDQFPNDETGEEFEATVEDALEKRL
jgi:hypothetical protein